MTRVTRTAINRALREVGNVTIERGRGYWYFAGNDACGFEATIVGSYHLGAFPVEWYVNEFKARRAEQRRYWAACWA